MVNPLRLDNSLVIETKSETYFKSSMLSNGFVPVNYLKSKINWN